MLECLKKSNTLLCDAFGCQIIRVARSHLISSAVTVVTDRRACHQQTKPKLHSHALTYKLDLATSYEFIDHPASYSLSYLMNSCYSTVSHYTKGETQTRIDPSSN